MVRSNADGFYRYAFAVQGGGATLPEYAIEYYVSLYNRDRDALRASFGLYRAWDATLGQNKERAAAPLTIPVDPVTLRSGAQQAAPLAPHSWVR